MKPTHDNWCGNYSGDMVEVIVADITAGMKPRHVPEWRVSVWGNDDLGLYIDLGGNKDQAMALYRQIIAMEYVDMEPLYDLGLERF